MIKKIFRARVNPKLYKIVGQERHLEINKIVRRMKFPDRKNYKTAEKDLLLIPEDIRQYCEVVEYSILTDCKYFKG